MARKRASSRQCDETLEDVERQCRTRGLCRAKENAGIVGRDGVGGSRDLDRGIVELAQVNCDVGFEREARWRAGGCSAGWRAELARIHREIQLYLETMDVGSSLVEPEVQAGGEIVHAIKQIVDVLLRYARYAFKLA